MTGEALRNLQGYLGNVEDLAAVSIERLRTFEPPEGYYVAFSGGKDSQVLLEMVRRSGVKHDAHYNNVGIDPPELRAFIREHYPEVEWNRPPESFGKAMLRKRFPPMRQQRWCCELLKENGGNGRFVVTGIRAAESARRARRQYVETCKRDPLRRYLHPIIDWPTEAVWAYIRDHAMAYCSLYDEGRERIGCLLCPIASVSHRAQEAARFPKMAHAFVSMFRRLLELRRSLGLNNLFGTWDAEKAFRAWLNKGGKPDEREEADGQQCFRFEDN